MKCLANDDMNLYKELRRIENYVSKRFVHFGSNKKREIIRLIYEIVKRNKNNCLDFIQGDFKSYQQLKAFLLKIRYPYSYGKIDKKNFYLPALEINKSDAFIFGNFRIYPSKIYYEKAVKNSEILQKFKRKFLLSSFIEIDSFKELKTNFTISDYNQRLKNFFIIKEKQDFIKPCPCTKNCFSCNYFVFNLGFGCPYECSYCFLQGYQNISGIVIQANIEDFFLEFNRNFSGLKRCIRIGTGEFSDSLALDDITSYSMKLVDFFRGKENVYFEFKTKSENISNLLNVEPSENIVISFSFNPSKIIKNNEFYTASFKKRLEAMKKLLEYGYSVAFHLDPIIKIANWENLYYDMIKEIFSVIAPQNIKWVSCGTFRFKRETKKVIESRFINNEILDEEMVIDFDGKLRYPFEIRAAIYQRIIKYLLSQGLEKSKIYLCMESVEMWKKLGIDFRFGWEI